MYLARRGENDGPIGVWYLMLVTGLGALLRFYHLGYQSLWVDEFFTWRWVRPDTDLHFWEQIFQAIQGPLYMATIWPLVRWGSSEFLLRLPAALVGVATIPLFTLTAQRIIGVKTARWGALLLAFSPFHLWYCQEARGYAFVMFFAVAASLVFWNMMQRGPRLATASLYALLITCGMLSNLSGLFLLAAHGMTFLVWARPPSRRAWGWWLVAFVSGLLLLLPWFLRAFGDWAVERLVPGAATGVAMRGESTFSLFALPFTGFAFLFGYSLGPPLRELHQTDRLQLIQQYWPLLLVAAGVATAAWWAALARLRGRLWSLVLWVAIPLLAVILLALRNVKPFNPRYVAVGFPWVLLLTAHGLLGLRRWRRWVVTAILLSLSLWSVAQYHCDTRYAKADMRGAAAWVAAREAPGEPVLVPVVHQVFQYYYHGPARVLDSLDQSSLRSEEDARVFLLRKLNDASSCRIVLARSWFLDPQDFLPLVLHSQGTIVEEEQLNGVRLYRWKRHRVQ